MPHDDDDEIAIHLDSMWDQVQRLSERLSIPLYAYGRVLDLLVAALKYQQLPGKDVEALLLEVMRLVRDELIAAL